MGELLAGVRWPRREHGRKGAALAMTAWWSVAPPTGLVAPHHPRAGASGRSRQGPPARVTERAMADAPACEVGANCFLHRFETMRRQSMPAADLPLPARKLES
ncbi:hypothetical protein [Roseateles sp.]|uniref:hypothetical protein n=1 Tax=Roseateles sp. TaxID=1971397 RepID=UPI0039ECF5A1